jgi:hypothetical protein
MSVFSSILWVTCSVKATSPTLLSYVRPLASRLRTRREHPALGTPPEPYVVPLGRGCPQPLLVGEILLAVEQMQRADGCLVVATPAQCRRQDPPPAGQSQVAARIHPARVMAA